jgi:hypothetical protein
VDTALPTGRDSRTARRKDMQALARPTDLTGVMHRLESGTPAPRSRPTITCSRRSIRRSSMGVRPTVPASTVAGPPLRTVVRSRPIVRRPQDFSATISAERLPLVLALPSLGLPASQLARAAASTPSVAAIPRKASVAVVKALAAAGRASVAATQVEEAGIISSANITRVRLGSTYFE